MKNYVGDVEVVVRMRYRVDADFERTPTKAAMLKVLRTGDYSDIMDTEELEIVSVGSIGPNLGDDE